ncbi:hypothetical protein AB0G73_36530 [Streptomyces sp. NPDC020719]|uniref:hypothetical protein n=1 Tax=Streptomyces sp. NPDC020719 TaxID=3154896 RepID=UPI003411F38F
MTHTPTSPVAARRFTRRAATGCLILLLIPAGLLAYFWYSAWHTGHVNDQRRQAALASILNQARHATNDTTHALNTSSTTDTDTLTGVIWQHTHAPLITYDTSRRTFTATATRSAAYSEKALLPGGGPVTVSRCFTFTSTRGTSANWTTTMTEQDEQVCRPGQTIDHRATLAKNRIKNMPAAQLTRADLTQALDPAHQQDTYIVKDTMRHGQTATITILIHAQRDASATAAQCYQFARHIDTNDAERATTGMPIATC